MRFLRESDADSGSLRDGLWRVSYTSFDVQKDESYTGQGKVAAHGGTYVCGAATV